MLFGRISTKFWTISKEIVISSVITLNKPSLEYFSFFTNMYFMKYLSSFRTRMVLCALILWAFAAYLPAQNKDSSASSSSTSYFITDPPPPVVLPPVGNASYLVTRLGASAGLVQDAALSPLRYLGAGGVVGVEFRAYQGITYLSIGTDVVGNLLSPTIGNDLSASQILSIQLLATTALGFRIVNEEENAFRVYVGGLLQSLTHLKTQTAFGNSAVATDGYTSLGGMARVEKDFSLFGKAFRASSQLNVPIFGIATRPSYSTPTRYPASGASNLLITLFADTQFVSFASLPYIGFRNSLEYMFPSGNFIALNYDWDFYSYNYFNKVQSARQGVSVSLHYKF